MRVRLDYVYPRPQCCFNKIFTTHLHVHSLLPQCCVEKGSYHTSPCCHSAVSIILFTTPLHVQIFAATVLCQKGLLLPHYMYKSLLPQGCVKKGSYYPSTCTSPYCHSAVSIRVITTPLHVQVLTVTVLCQ